MVFRISQAAILLSKVEPCRDNRVGVLLCPTRWTFGFSGLRVERRKQKGIGKIE